MFGRTTPPRAPRWGFRIGWDDFVLTVRDQLARRGVELAEPLPADGIVPLPEAAAYDRWDLRPIAAACRERSPQDWAPVIAESLDEAFGAQVGLTTTGAAAAPTQGYSQGYIEQLRVQLYAGGLAPLLSGPIAHRALGDLAEVMVAEMHGAEQTLTRGALAALGLSLDDAFALGRRNAAAVMAEQIRLVTGELPGARVEMLVSNGFYLSGALLAARAELAPGAPVLVAPLTWHHWLVFTLAEGASRATLAAIRASVDQTIGSITTLPAGPKWLSPSPWWWPGGAAAPVVLAAGAELPADLARLLGR